MKRPYSFDDIRGHVGLVTYLKENLSNNTLAHFIIMEGPEGLGKTSLADIMALTLVYGSSGTEPYRRAYEEVVVNNQSNSFIKRFKCSVDGGKDVARLIKDEMSASFMQSRNKVIICDECHGLTDQAQDVFLSETEFINKNVYVFMLTTEVTRLKASLRSRAITLHLEPLKRAEMSQLLREEIGARGLRVQNPEAVIQLICDWSECKPRTGLNVLSAFSDGAVVSLETIRSLIGYLDVREIIPLLKSLGGSMTYGLSYIEEMPINNSIVTLVSECIQVMSGQPSYRLRMNDITYVREQLINVTVDQLVHFLYGLTTHRQLTKTGVVHAYIRAHRSFGMLTTPDTSNMLGVENAQRADVARAAEPPKTKGAPRLSDLLADSALVTQGGI